MDLENNDASLPSSNASLAEKVAPEPLEADELHLLFEDAVPDFEEPAFQVYFQNDNGQTEVTVEGVDQEMLLFDLTLAFNESGVRSPHSFVLISPWCLCDVRRMMHVLVSQLFSSSSFTLSIF